MKNDPFPGDAARACTDAFPTDHASQITKAETEWRSKEDFMQQSASLAGEIVRLKRELEAAEAALVAEKRAREEAAAIAKDLADRGYSGDAIAAALRSRT